MFELTLVVRVTVAQIVSLGRVLAVIIALLV